ncbi:hypothetical protein BGX33_008088 [Mortierella sp. NVP41]|nr:hypothetical protein BGX33_008088 [Mortierella sp. NVP41]
MSYQTQSPPSLRTTLSTAESYDSTDSAIFSIERSAERATTPSATLDDRSISHGIAAVFIEHSRLIPPVQPADRAATHDGDGDSVSSLRIRKRDKIFAYFWPAPSEPQAEAEIEEPLNEKGDIHNAQDSACTTPDQVPSEPDQQGSKEIVASNESSQAESSTDPADTNNTDAKELYSADLPIAYWDVFPQNDDKPMGQGN